VSLVPEGTIEHALENQTSLLDASCSYSMSTGHINSDRRNSPLFGSQGNTDKKRNFGSLILDIYINFVIILTHFLFLYYFVIHSRVINIH
jgi:hypothetical protein